MGKLIQRNIDPYLFDIIMEPIRTKENLATILLETLKIFLIDDISTTQSKGTVLLKVDKMSRLIFNTSDKIFSFNFPFSIETSGDNSIERVYDSTFGIDIDHQTISMLLSIFCNDALNLKTLDELYDELCNSEAQTNSLYNVDDLWILLKKLIIFESGYLRFDYDEEHDNGFLHPLNHFDIYYSPTNTFKVGLDNKIIVDDFIDILNLDTNCYFFRK